MTSPEFLTDLRGWFTPLKKSAGVRRVWLHGSRASGAEAPLDSASADLDFVVVVDVFDPDKQRHIVERLGNIILNNRRVIVETRSGPISPSAPPEAVMLHMTLHDRTSWANVSPAVRLLNSFGATPIIGRHPSYGRRLSINRLCSALSGDLHLFYEACSEDRVYWRQWSQTAPYHRAVGWSPVETCHARDKLHRQIVAQLKAWIIILVDYQDCHRLSEALVALMALTTRQHASSSNRSALWLKDGIGEALAAISHDVGAVQGAEFA